MPDLTGQSFGPYHILEPLGEGGMAAVYKGFDTRLERNVAIKVILSSRQQNEKFIKRFEREAHALAQLVHPNIVGIIDYGHHDGVPYLVMEYLHGGTLKKMLTGKPIFWQEASHLLAPIARALEFAHQRQIIHRDVKPSNILITESGQPMLSDFGIAKILDSEETADLTGSGAGIGTPEYMAPEQGMGKLVDGRADVYALGIVLYEMVTGRKPYHADTPAAILLKQMTEPLPRPSSFVKNLPDIVETTLIKALARDPNNRFANMGDFASRLEQMAEGKFQTAGTHTHKPLVPRWVWAGVGTFICIVFFGVLAVSGMVKNLLNGALSKGEPIPTSISVYTIPSPANVDLQPTVTNLYSSPTQSQITKVATELPAPTPETSLPVCPGPLPSRLSVGANAEVTTSGKAWQLRLRADASFDASTNNIIAAGRNLLILKGPICAEGSFWWYVRSEQGYEGWAPEGDFEDYWIDPVN